MLHFWQYNLETSYRFFENLYTYDLKKNNIFSGSAEKQNFHILCEYLLMEFISHLI